MVYGTILWHRDEHFRLEVKGQVQGHGGKIYWKQHFEYSVSCMALEFLIASTAVVFKCGH